MQGSGGRGHGSAQHLLGLVWRDAGLREDRSSVFADRRRARYRVTTGPGWGAGNAHQGTVTEAGDGRGFHEREAVLRQEPEKLDELLHQTFDRSVESDVIARGLGASPGAAR